MDEDGGIGDLLESINIKKGIEIDIGTSFESPRHIIEVDCIFSNSSAENLNSNEKEKQANVENIGLKKRPFSKISKSSSKVEENLIPEEKKADIQEEVYQEEIRYSVMYTKQKTKKSKIWHDGILKLRHGVHVKSHIVFPTF